MIQRHRNKPKNSVRRPHVQSDSKVAVGLLLSLIPVAIALAVWLSPLAFVPVPWPDDSAFYFVGKDFFQWPPRWVMIPQAPFEPTYRIFNFNTMPLYPILIGLGRLFGIDGSFAIKAWPLLAWALSGSLLTFVLFRAGLPALATLLVALAFSLDPILRWASVLVRPESLIGLLGAALILGLALGFPEKLKPKNLWDPVAALLAISAYAHFNAIHLVFPVIIFYILDPNRIFGIAWRTALYLSPWIAIVLWHFDLFLHQMGTQWNRLAVPNHWLDSVNSAIGGLLQNLGSPEAWAPQTHWLGVALWILIFGAGAWLLIDLMIAFWKPERRQTRPLAPAAAWVLSSVWLWHTKPEVWFVYYIHVSALCLAGLALLLAWKALRQHPALWPKLGFSALLGLVALIGGVGLYANWFQFRHLSASSSWKWSTYHSYIECIDRRLVQEEKHVQNPERGKPFTVWNPTFPDVTIELSRRHPEWEFTRTNDFSERVQLALQHGREVDAVVVTETLQWHERDISAPMREHPEIESVWMNWNGYFLKTLWLEEGWKPERYLCQRGRWQAFLFMNAPRSEPAIR